MEQEHNVEQHNLYVRTYPALLAGENINIKQKGRGLIRAATYVHLLRSFHKLRAH